jgi:DNA-directed RNA polymerase beta' subunit|tara:strand:- start:6297 stop:9710 length:3414 start_codon:yes stop_codon:yes gene_type:complete
MSTFFFNQEIDKGELRRLIAWHLTTHGRVSTLNMVEKLKTLGFHHATAAGISLGLEDLKIPPAKQLLLASAEKEVSGADDRFSRGKITAVERSQQILDIWNAASELLKDEVVAYLQETDLLNPVYMMAFSGARGNLSQVRQLVGMRGLMSDPQGEIIDIPIKSNFREGLTVTEYIISCYGARKGLVDTALKTANSGYLTRRLVDVAQAVIIKEVDCGTREGIFLESLIENNKVLLPLRKRLVGRVLARPIRRKWVYIAERNQDICPVVAYDIISFKQKKVYVRSPLTCQTIRHVCKLCYGWSLANGSMVDLGEAVGIIAAQSIGEPGTQLTMRTFHTGGVFSTDVADRIYAPHHGILTYDLSNKAKKTRTPFGQEAVFFDTAIDLSIKKISLKSSAFDTKLDTLNQVEEDTIISIPAFTLIYIKPGQKIYWRQVIAELSDLQTILSGPKTNLGVRAIKEVCSSISGQVFFHQLTTISFKPESELEKNQKKSKVKTKKVKKKTTSIEQKSTIYIVGNAFIYVIEGQVIPSSSLQLPLVKKLDITLITKRQDIEVETNFQEKSYCLPLRPAIIGFQFPQTNLLNGSKTEGFSWIAGNVNDSLGQIFFGNQVLPLCDTYKEHQPENNLKDQQTCLTTSSQLDGIKNSASHGFFNQLYPVKGKEKKTENLYCFDTSPPYSINETFTFWFYLPKQKDFPTSPKKLKKLFTKNLTVIKPFTKTIDAVQFNEPVFIEWKLFSTDENSKMNFGLVFRKQISNHLLHSTLNQEQSSMISEDSSVIYSVLPGTPSLRKTTSENYLLNSKVEPISPEKAIQKEILIKTDQKNIRKKNKKNDQDNSKESRKKKKNEKIEEKCFLFDKELHQVKYSLNGKKPIVKMARFVCRGDQLAVGIKATISGIVRQITKTEITLGRANPYRASNKSLLSVSHRSFIYEGATLFHLMYQKAKTEDIVQGLPKIEELLEARRTKDLQPIPNNSHDKLQELFASYKSKYGTEIAARISLQEIQQFLVEGVQKVYQSQGVDISDKHVEIIVKQMTSRVFIIHGGQTPLLYGDLVELYKLNKLNEDAIRCGRQTVTYAPIILGITKASLKTESFLSAASFQETTRVLTQAAVQGRLDSFRGLKENVLMGKLIPAGTGFLQT